MDSDTARRCFITSRSAKQNKRVSSLKKGGQSGIDLRFSLRVRDCSAELSSNRFRLAFALVDAALAADGHVSSSTDKTWSLHSGHFVDV